MHRCQDCEKLLSLDDLIRGTLLRPSDLNSLTDANFSLDILILHCKMPLASAATTFEAICPVGRCVRPQLNVGGAHA